MHDQANGVVRIFEVFHRFDEVAHDRTGMQQFVTAGDGALLQIEHLLILARRLPDEGDLRDLPVVAGNARFQLDRDHVALLERALRRHVVVRRRLRPRSGPENHAGQLGTAFDHAREQTHVDDALRHARLRLGAQDVERAFGQRDSLLHDGDFFGALDEARAFEDEVAVDELRAGQGGAQFFVHAVREDAFGVTRIAFEADDADAPAFEAEFFDAGDDVVGVAPAAAAARRADVFDPVLTRVPNRRRDVGARDRRDVAAVREDRRDLRVVTAERGQVSSAGLKRVPVAGVRRHEDAIDVIGRHQFAHAFPAPVAFGERETRNVTALHRDHR